MLCTVAGFAVAAAAAVSWGFGSVLVETVSAFVLVLVGCIGEMLFCTGELLFVLLSRFWRRKGSSSEQPVEAWEQSWAIWRFPLAKTWKQMGFVSEQPLEWRGFEFLVTFGTESSWWNWCREAIGWAVKLLLLCDIEKAMSGLGVLWWGTRFGRELDLSLCLLRWFLLFFGE